MSIKKNKHTYSVNKENINTKRVSMVVCVGNTYYDVLRTTPIHKNIN